MTFISSPYTMPAEYKTEIARLEAEVARLKDERAAQTVELIKADDKVARLTKENEALTAQLVDGSKLGDKLLALDGKWSAAECDVFGEMLAAIHVPAIPKPAAAPQPNTGDCDTCRHEHELIHGHCHACSINTQPRSINHYKPTTAAPPCLKSSDGEHRYSSHSPIRCTVCGYDGRKSRADVLRAQEREAAPQPDPSRHFHAGPCDSSCKGPLTHLDGKAVAGTITIQQAIAEQREFMQHQNAKEKAFHDEEERNLGSADICECGHALDRHIGAEGQCVDCDGACKQFKAKGGEH